MHLDTYGLPVQADGDANDQLQRVGQILVAMTIAESASFNMYKHTLERALNESLQPAPGVYVRCVGNNANNVSADQLIPALAAHVCQRNTKQVLNMFKAMVKRAGFAQNYKDGLSGQDRTKIPDFMFFRALPLFARVHWSLYPVVLLSDVLLVISALSACGPVWRDDKWVPSKRSPDDCDDNVLVATLATCRARMVTPLSWLACRIYGKFRPWNLGCADDFYFDKNAPEAFRLLYSHRHHPVYGALRWYHRAEAGGNPEIAELWRPICKKYFE